MQPHRLVSIRNRSTSSLLNKDATEMDLCKIRGTTQPSSHAPGLEDKEISSPLQKLSLKLESLPAEVRVWQPVFGVTGVVVGGTVLHSTLSLCRCMLDRT